MVFKFVTWLLLVVTSAQAGISPARIQLQWPGSESKQCQRLVEAFLAELRSIASDHVIEIDLASAGMARGPARHDSDEQSHEKESEVDATRLELECPAAENAAPILNVRSDSGTIPMRYLAKAQGFDASDWLPLQQRYLRPTPKKVMLAPQGLSTPLAAQAELPIAPSLAEGSGGSILKKWWFWTILAGASASALAITQLGGRSSDRINVEIH